MERQMAIVGAKQLNENHKAAITSETANIERIGENANLASYAQTISQGMTNVLLTVIAHGEVQGTAEDNSKFNFTVTVETLPQKIDATELNALLAALSYKVVTIQDILNILVRRGVLPDDTRLPDLAATLAEQKALFEEFGLNEGLDMNGDNANGGNGDDDDNTNGNGDNGNGDNGNGGSSGGKGKAADKKDGGDAASKSAKKPQPQRRKKTGDGKASATPNAK